MWELALGISLFLLGWVLAIKQEYYYIKLKSDPKWRTAICIDGKFYYVVPEGEYTKLRIVDDA